MILEGTDGFGLTKKTKLRKIVLDEVTAFDLDCEGSSHGGLTYQQSTVHCNHPIGSIRA